MGPIYYPDRIQFRVTATMRAAVDEAAAQRQMSPADYARWLILLGLKAEGIDFREPEVA